jgi:hypothetical protein
MKVASAAGGGGGGGGDVDGDTYTVAQGDCDDNDPTVNPGATEIPDNGKDDDCNSSTLDSSGDQALIDSINEPRAQNKEWQLTQILKDNYPLSDAVLIAMINRDPLMSNSGNKDVLKDYKVGETLLSEAVLSVMINQSTLMSSFNFMEVLINNSPLPQSIVDEINAGMPTTMTQANRDAVIAAQ